MPGGFPRIWSNCKEFSTSCFFYFLFSFLRPQPKSFSRPRHMRYQSTAFGARMCHLWAPFGTVFSILVEVGLKTSILRLPHMKLMLKTLQFLNHCRSRINRIKQQKLALPKSPTLDSYNGHQLIQLT